MAKRHPPVDSQKHVPRHRERERASREMVGASNRDNARNRALRLRCSGITHETAERMAYEKNATTTRELLDFGQSPRHVLADKLAHIMRPARAEVFGAAVASKVEVKHVKTSPREVTRKAP